MKGNPRITPKDRNAIKGALRRAFARSELHRQVLDAAEVRHSDPARPRVKRWARCNVCKLPEARSYVVVDHVLPVIPLDTTFEAQGADETANRLWSPLDNLQAICPRCHDEKSARERAQRPKKPRKRK